MSSQSRRIDCKSKEKKEKPKMLPMWIFICFDERSEETHENSLWWKIIQIPMSCTCSVFNVQASNLEDQLKIIRGEKSNSKQCDFCDNFFVSLYFHNNIFPTQKKMHHDACVSVEKNGLKFSFTQVEFKCIKY